MLKNILSTQGIISISKSKQKNILGGGGSGSSGSVGKPECGYIIPGTTNHIKECGTNYYCASGRCKRINIGGN